MSAKWTFWAWEQPIKTAPKKLALLQLANNANDDGVSWYSIGKMAKSCGVSQRTFQRHIQELENDGLLHVERRSNRPSIYTLKEEVEVVLHGSGCQTDAEGCHSDMAGCQRVTSRGVRESHDLNSNLNTYPDSSLVGKKSQRSKFKFNDDQMNFAVAVLQKVILITPAMKNPNLDNWANSARLMNEVDGVDLSHAWEVFCWANADSFWSTNILSVAKLRDKYAVLCAKMNGKQSGSVDIMQQSANSDWHKGDLGL